MKNFCMCLLAVIAMAILAAGAVQAQQIDTRTFSCLGERGVCIRWHNKGSNTWHKIKGLLHNENPYPWGFGSACPDGSDSAANIFLFDDETGTTGIGYIGCLVCISATANLHNVVESQAGTQIFTSYPEWEAAVLRN